MLVTMDRSRISFRPFACACGLAICSQANSPAVAAPANRNSVVNMIIARPVSLTKLSDLDFATLTVSAAGTATINPATDAVTTTGGVNYLTGASRAAHFRIDATRLALVIIRIPSAPLTLTRLGGTETMTVSNWTLDGFPVRIITNAASTDFAVGGTLSVAANQADGTYTGVFSVTADYF